MLRISVYVKTPRRVIRHGLVSTYKPSKPCWQGYPVRFKGGIMSRALTRPVVAFALAASLISLTGCSAGDVEADSDQSLPASSELTEPTEPVEVTWIDAANDNIQVGETIAAFEAEHPNITINYITVPYSDYDTVLSTRLETEDIDILTVDQTSGPSYYANGWLTDLTDVFSEDLHLLDSASVEASTFDDKLLSAPRQSDTTVLFYNKDILNELGVDTPSSDPEDPAVTWEWLREVSEQAQAEELAEWGITWERIANRYYQWPLVEQLGGGSGVTEEDSTYPNLNSDAAVEALEWYGDLYADEISPRGDTTSIYTDLFASGSSVFHTGGTWDIETLNANPDLNYGIAKFPVFEDGEEASNSGGYALGLYSGSEKKEAALIVLKELVFDEDGGELNFNADASSPPANNAGKEIYWSLEKFQDERTTGIQEIVEYQLENDIAKQVLLSYASVEINSITNSAIADIANGSDAATRLNQAQEEAIAETEEYR